MIGKNNICKDKIGWIKDHGCIKVEKSQTGKLKYAPHIIPLLRLIGMIVMIVAI